MDREETDAEREQRLRAEGLLGVTDGDDVVWSGSPRSMYDPDARTLRQEALEGAVEHGDVTWFDSPLSQHRRRQAQHQRERDATEQDAEHKPE